MSIEWIENPALLRLEDGCVLKMSRTLNRSDARRLSRSRQVIESIFPDLSDVTGDVDRIHAMLRDYDDRPRRFAWTASLYSGDGPPAVVFDFAH